MNKKERNEESKKNKEFFEARETAQQGHRRHR